MINTLYVTVVVNQDPYLILEILVASLCGIAVVSLAIWPSQKAKRFPVNFMIKFKYVDYPMNQTILYTDPQNYSLGSVRQAELFEKKYPVGGDIKGVPIDFLKIDGKEDFISTSIKDCKISRVRKIIKYNDTSATYYYNIFFEEYEKCEFPIEFTKILHIYIDKILVNNEGITFFYGSTEINSLKWDELLFIESSLELTFFLKADYNYTGNYITFQEGKSMDSKEYNYFKELIHKYANFDFANEQAHDIAIFDVQEDKP